MIPTYLLPTTLRIAFCWNTKPMSLKNEKKALKLEALQQLTAWPFF